jgi:serine/threonine protein kinase
MMDSIKIGKNTFCFDHLKNKDNIKDDYIFSDILGTGAFGEVRKCINKKSGMVRAVKIIKKKALDPKE